MNADRETVNIDSQLFDIIGENKIGSELVKPEIIATATTENDPINNLTKNIVPKMSTCNIAQSHLDQQVLSIVIKQPWNEATKAKDGKR